VVVKADTGTVRVAKHGINPSYMHEDIKDGISTVVMVMAPPLLLVSPFCPVSQTRRLSVGDELYIFVDNVIPVGAKGSTLEGDSGVAKEVIRDIEACRSMDETASMMPVTFCRYVHFENFRVCG